MNKVHHIGNFEVTGDKLRVTDPCYDVDTWCSGVLENVKTGTWQASVDRGNDGFFGNINQAIIVCHKDHAPILPDDTRWKLIEDLDVGVDSGQAGFFDPAFYQRQDIVPEKFCTPGEDDPWYEWVGDLTLNTKLFAGVLTGGAVSRSGLGDGGYNCYAVRDGDIIVAAKIVFYGDEEDDCDEEDEDIDPNVD